MRTTLRIEDDLLRELKQQARRRKTSLTKMANEMLRSGLRASGSTQPPRKRFRQRTFDLGPPLVDLTKASALAERLEDDAIIEKLSRGK